MKQTVFLYCAGCGLVSGWAVSYSQAWPLILIGGMFFLYLLALNKSVRKQTYLVIIYSFASLAGGMYWLPSGIYHPPVNSTVSVCLLSGLLLAGHAAVYAVAYVTIRSALTTLRCRSGPATITAMALAWPAAEIVRASGWWAMPWGLLGPSQLDNPLLAGFYPVVGAAGVAGLHWLLAGLGFHLIQTFHQRLTRNQFETNYCSLLTRRSALGVILAVSGWVGVALLLRDMTWTKPAGPSLRIRIVHTQWMGEEKYDPSVQQLAWKSLQAASADVTADLTVFPELFLTHTAGEISPQLRQAIVAETAGSGRSVLLGMPREQMSGDPPLRQNVLLQISDGETHYYVKQLLLPFSEYLPTVRWLAWAYPWMYRWPQADMVPGARGQIQLRAGPAPLGTTICSELAYAAFAARQSLGSTVLVNASNDGWIPSAAYAHQAHLAARVRAAEARRPMVRANNAGISAFIDPFGKVRSDLYGEPGSGIMEVMPMQGNTPFLTLVRLLGA